MKYGVVGWLVGWLVDEGGERKGSKRFHRFLFSRIKLRRQCFSTDKEDTQRQHSSHLTHLWSEAPLDLTVREFSTNYKHLEFLAFAAASPPLMCQGICDISALAQQYILFFMYTRETKVLVILINRGEDEEVLFSKKEIAFCPNCIDYYCRYEEEEVEITRRRSVVVYILLLWR